jgi:hypothetical protein
MARVQYGSIITDIKGSIGGLTFQSNKSAKIVRQRSYTRKGLNEKQNERVNAFASVIDNWRGLSGANKDAWNTYAASNDLTNRWNEVKTLTGYMWHQLINSNLKLVGESLRDTPASSGSPLTIGSYTLVFSASEVSVEWSPSLSHSNHYLLIFSTYPRRAPAYYDRKAYRLTKIVDPGTTGKVDFTTDYESTHNIDLSNFLGTIDLCTITAILSIHKDYGWSSVFSLKHDYS